MNIGFFELEPWEKEILQKSFPKDNLFFSSKKIAEGRVGKQANLDIAVVFVKSQFNKKVLDKLPKIKMLATMSTGYDHIDLEECKKRKITVCNVPAYGINTVAEQAFALILCLSRKIIAAANQTSKGTFRQKGLRGFDLKDKVIGVIGTGNIGKHVIKIANGFGMKVIAFDAFKNDKLQKEFNFKYVPLNTLLKTCDILTIHIPENKDTHHLINKEKLALMKKTAYLINTSRGGIVDTDALTKALQKKRIAGAGLDVLEEEKDMFNGDNVVAKDIGKEEMRTVLENHILLEMPNVIVTPHNAFNTQEAMERILDTTIKNIKGFKKGRKINVIQ
jgi:D-lactate dehydrogenase